jgi:hypothetical protein
MFVVPLYAFLTTTVKTKRGGAHGRGQQHRQFGRDGRRLAARDRAVGAGVAVEDQLLLAAAMCLVSAWLAWKLHKACDDKVCTDTEILPEDV